MNPAEVSKRAEKAQRELPGWIYKGTRLVGERGNLHTSMSPVITDANAMSSVFPHNKHLTSAILIFWSFSYVLTTVLHFVVYPTQSILVNGIILLFLIFSVPKSSFKK